MNKMRREISTFLLIVPSFVAVTNVGSYIDERYFSHLKPNIEACKDASQTIERYYGLTGRILFSGARKGAEKFYANNCR